MEGIWKRAVILGAVGMILGIFVGAGFWYLFPHESMDDSEVMRQLVLHLLLSGVFGMVANGSSAIYGIDEWSIARATITHFVITMGTFYTVAFTLGWFYPSDPVCWIMTVVCIVGYFMIWLVQYQLFKGKVKRMNEELRKWRAMRHLDEPFRQ